MKVYPNPAFSGINITVKDDDLPARIKIFSVQGKLQCQQTINQHHTLIDTRSWKPGIYFLMGTSRGHELLIRRFVKQ